MKTNSYLTCIYIFLIINIFVHKLNKHEKIQYDWWHAKSRKYTVVPNT